MKGRWKMRIFLSKAGFMYIWYMSCPDDSCTKELTTASSHIIHHIVKFVLSAQVRVTSDRIFWGQIFGLILHTHCRRPARLTEAMGIVLSYRWWASALSFKCFSICSLWHPGCPRALRLFKLLKGPQLFSLSCARMPQACLGCPQRLLSLWV